MAAESRPENTALTREILHEFLGDFSAKRYDFYEFDFFQAVRLFCRLNHAGAPGRSWSPTAEVIRFRAHDDLAFPPNTIHSLVWPPAREDNSYPPVQMTVCFMGLTGPSGVLPWPYSEHVRRLSAARDHATADFFNIFDHRAISFFYRAWEKYRFFVQFEREREDVLFLYLMNLVGLGTPGLQHRQAIPDRGVVFFSGILSLLPRSAAALEQAIAQWFDIPVRVDQLQGAWHPLRDEDCCRFADPGTESETLGVGVIAGDAIYDRGSRARIRLGPLSIRRYQDFLPGGVDYPQLHALADFFANGTVDFEVQLVLKRTDVPEFVADGANVPLRLGWTTWMNARSLRTHDPGDTCIMLS